PAMALTAAAAFVLLTAGASPLYFIGNPKPPEPKIVEIPKVAPLPQGGTATVTTGCKLDLPTALADDFKNADPGWALPSQTASYADGQLLLNSLEGRTSRALYPSFRFKNVTVCAQIMSPPKISTIDGNLDGGVIFWATDTSNFYLASIYPNGTYSIYRMASDNWAMVSPRTGFAGIKQGPNSINEIQVATRDNTATVYINGAKVQEFRGQPPKD